MKAAAVAQHTEKKEIAMYTKRSSERSDHRTQVIDKSEVCQKLHRAAEFHLLGPGLWPADQEAVAAVWRLLQHVLLGDEDPDQWDLPPKPKWMRMKNENYVRRFDHYEAALAQGPDGKSMMSRPK